MNDEPFSRVGRLALGGLAVGLLLGALGLAAASLMHGLGSCAGVPPDSAECQFILDTGREVARFQALGAAGSALVSGGLLMYLRSLH